MSTAIISLSDRLPEIAAACRANDVKRLDLFGSRARADFAADSDVDFLVEFQNPLQPGVLDRYLALHVGLERITGCRVDLVEQSAIENPVLRERIDDDRMTVYAA